MNQLGIYFGPQAVRIVETKGRQPVNNVRISRQAILGQGLSQEKVPEEVKLIMAIKEELRKNKIQAEEVTVGLSGKDLVIRIFEMPLMPRQELANAVSFEVKKYIPFRMEEMISDFQFKLDKANRKNYVLFMGIKKEVLDRYLSVLKQTGLKVKAIEYSGFSVLRLVSLSNIANKEVTALVNINLKEDDEINFMVLEGGFPLFSRDIHFAGEPQAAPDKRQAAEQAGLERLKNELRVSLSYYDRTFSYKHISRVFFLAEEGHRADLESFMKEMGLSAQFINVSKSIGADIPYSLEFVKGYCSSLSRIATPIKLDLLAAKEKTIKTAEKELPLSIKRFKPQIAAAVIGLFIPVFVFISGMLRVSPLKKEIKNIIETRSAGQAAGAQSGYEELVSIDSDYKTKIKAADDLVRKQLLFTELLDAIPRVLPKDMRLTEISFEKEGGRAELALNGSAYLGESSRELELVNFFLSRLKGDAVFSRYFGNISIVSIDHGQSKDRSVTNFKISCRDYR